MSVGQNTWDAWLTVLQDKGMKEHILEQPSPKNFKFGNGHVLKALKSVTFPVCVFGVMDRVTAHIVPGDTPFLWSKGLLAKWSVIQDFRNAKVNFADRDREWHDVEQNEKGHFVFDLLDGVEKYYGEALFLDTLYEEPEKADEIEIPDEFAFISSFREPVIWEVFVDERGTFPSSAPCSTQTRKYRSFR